MLEAFLSLLDGERTDEIVWTADITYWIDGQRRAGTAKREWDTEQGYLQLHRELGILPYFYYAKLWVAEPRYDGEVEIVETRNGVNYQRQFRTPIGKLTEETMYSSVSCSVGHTKYLVESEKDLDILRYILEHRRLEPTNLDDYAERRKMWAAYDGLPSLGLPRSPLSAICCEWAGMLNTTYLIVDCEEKVRCILELMEEQEQPILEAVCESKPPLIHFPDNMSSENLTSFYDGFMANAHKRRLKRLHEAGVKCAVHLDGTIKGLFNKLIDSGFDAIEALTPKPGGDLDMTEIRELAGTSGTILWGGVPGVMFAPPFTWEQMDDHVRQLLDCWKDVPYVMGVADQVPPDGDIEFCKNISTLVQR